MGTMTTPKHTTMVGASYCPSGLGKTTDMLYSFPRGLFLGRNEAFRPASFVGYTPVVVPVRGIRGARAIIEELIRTHRIHEFDAVVIDDATIMMDETVSDMEAGRNGYRKATGWALWGGVIDELLEFLELCRSSLSVVWFTGHESPPTIKQGQAIRGSISLPGKLPEKFPALIDTIVRIRAAPNRKGRGWPVEVWCGGPLDPTYITKDRNTVIPEIAPLNTAEYLRASGIPLRRAPGLEWMDGAVDALASRMYDVTQPMIAEGKMPMEIDAMEKQIVTAFRGKLSEKGVTDPRQVAWVLRDAYDRIDLRRARAQMFNLYG